MKWNSKNSTYYDKGKKAYGFGDEIPDEVLEKMGQETFDEYLEKGWIDDGTAAAEAKVKAEAAAESKVAAKKEAEAKVESERDVLMEKAKGYGLTPHYRAGIPKLEAMIEDYEALQELKKEALELGIDPSDDVGFAELSALVEEKKAENESDS